MTFAQSSSSRDSPTARSSPTGRCERLKWCTYRAADHVVSTNDSYRRSRCTVAATARRRDRGPNWSRPRPTAARTAGSSTAQRSPVLGRLPGRDGSARWSGIGVRAVDHVVHRLGRSDISFTFIGSGECFDDLVGAARRGRLADTWSSRAGARRRRCTPALHCRHWAMPGSEEPAQRRLHHEQDDGIHGLRAAGGRLRPSRDPGLCRRGGRLRRAKRSGRLRRADRRAAGRRAPARRMGTRARPG